ncbi:MAG: hypothetical protein AB7H93_14325 [Vicinamibacterales bacterium]
MRIIASALLVGAVVVASGSVPAAGDTQQAAAVPTYTKDVAPILFKNCTSCHRPGEVAPMTLQSYEDTRPWARAIKQKVVRREMPPWFADPNHGQFKNDRLLSTADIDTIAKWVDAGAPRGNPTDMPALPTFAEGWQGGEPDHVFIMPEFKVPAEGEIPMMNFWVQNPLKEDVFVEALEMRPGNPSVVHHGRIDVVALPPGHTVENGILMGPDGKPAFDPAGGVRDTADATGQRFQLIAFVPGRGYERYPPGTGKRISAGLWLRFNLHYQAKGVADTDATKLGIWFSKVPVHHEMFTRDVGMSLPTEAQFTTYVQNQKDLVIGHRTAQDDTDKIERLPNIPAYADNWRLAAVTAVTEPITVHAFWPHMHLRGKDMKIIATFPDGREETLLLVPKYDFNWQLQYDLATPLKVPAGSTLTAIGHYDNSLNNRYNPAPDREVYWAEQSWDEMFSPFIEYTVDSQTVAVPAAKAPTQQPR